jgi:hypothetical protein
MVLRSRLPQFESQHRPTKEATIYKSPVRDERFVAARHQNSMNSHDDSFREKFTFVTPRCFQKYVASHNPSPPRERWIYPVSDKRTKPIATPESPSPKPLYLFGKNDEIRDLEMEDEFLGPSNSPLVGNDDQIVSAPMRVARFCGSTLNAVLLTVNHSSDGNPRGELRLGLMP